MADMKEHTLVAAAFGRVRQAHLALGDGLRGRWWGRVGLREVEITSLDFGHIDGAKLKNDDNLGARACIAYVMDRRHFVICRPGYSI